MAKKIYIGNPDSSSNSNITLPNDLTLVQYIDSADTSNAVFIDFYPGIENFRFVVDLEILTTPSPPQFQYLFGTASASATDNAIRWGVYWYNGALHYMINNHYYDYGSELMSSLTGRHTFTMTNTTLQVDDNQITLEETLATTINYPCSILTNFYVNPSADRTAMCMASTRIYSCQIYSNDILIKNYVPAKTSNNIGALFDVINNRASQFTYSAPYLLPGAEYRSGKARPVTKLYIGVPEGDTPPETTVTEEVNINGDNITQYFIKEDANYSFQWNGEAFISNNASNNATTATTTLTALQDCPNLSFAYTYSTEQTFDKFTLVVAGSVIENKVSGVGGATWSGDIKQGDTISFSYSKDSSNSSNNDICTFSNLKFTTITIIPGVPSGTPGIARRIKKAYVGVNGKAQLFWRREIIAKYGELENLPATAGLIQMCAGSTRHKAMFLYGYGRTGTTPTATLQYYDSKLSYHSVNTYAAVAEAAGAANESMFIAAGGRAGTNSVNFTNLAVAYDVNNLTNYATLTNLYAAVRMATAVALPSCVMIASGYQNASSDAGLKAIARYDTTTATYHLLETLTTYGKYRAGVALKDYALFTSGDYGTWIDIYNSEGTKISTNVNLTYMRCDPGAARAGDYALFVSGGSSASTGNISSNNPTVDAISSTLTLSIPAPINQSVVGMSSVSLGDSALFCGGISKLTSGYASPYAYVYDSLLNLTQVDNCHEHFWGSAAAMNDYAIVAGGWISGTASYARQNAIAYTLT